MRKVHFIAITEPLLLDLALAIREKGFEISVSGKDLDEATLEKLRAGGCTCYGDGWFPEKLSKDIFTTVLGATVRMDNPELIQAKELGLLTQSIPEFIFQRTKSKTRVVIAGTRGRKSILSMMIYALKKQKLAFDYALTSEMTLLPTRACLNEESRIALIEGDEHITSNLEKRFQLEFYRPQIAVLSDLTWPEGTMPDIQEENLKVYRSFVASIEREGKLIYFDGNEKVSRLAQEVREDVTSIPYDSHPIIEKEGKTYIHTRYGDYLVYIPNAYFLIHLNAARLVCRQLGIKDENFYQAISEYSLSLQA